MSMKSLALTGGVAVLAVIAATGWYVFANKPTLDAPAPATIPVLDAQKQVVGQYTIPDDADALKEPNADQILYGKRLMEESARLLPGKVEDGLNCNSCHLADGKVNMQNTYINTINHYPKLNTRSGRVLNIVERINGCFQRSMNGNQLDPEGPEMGAMVAYMEWLRQDVKRGTLVAVKNAGPIDTSLVPDPAHGQVIYAEKCAACHGGDGEGTKDQAGNYIFPPLWGPESFNVGAGTARTYKAAAFVKYAMPPAMNLTPPMGAGGVLSDQDAVDVAEFFTHQPRPDYPPKVNDWPDGNKPKDARY